MLDCCAVVVTFNRKELLKECLRGIEAQILPVKHVIIIDNHSTDGTPEIINNFIAGKDYFSYVRLPKNSGGAGGFRKGVELAFQQGYEWIWLMDDDVEPRPDCLEKMTRHKG